MRFDNLFSSNIFIAASVVPPLEVTMVLIFLYLHLKITFLKCYLKGLTPIEIFLLELYSQNPHYSIIDSMKYIM